MATVVDIGWHYFSGIGNAYTTIEVNIPPAYLAAQTALHGVVNAAYTGIKHYRKRLDDGSDQDFDFGDAYSWPPVIIDYISSVTFAIYTGDPGQEAWLLARMDYWV